MSQLNDNFYVNHWKSRVKRNRSIYQSDDILDIENTKFYDVGGFVLVVVVKVALVVVVSGDGGDCVVVVGILVVAVVDGGSSFIFDDF